MEICLVTQNHDSTKFYSKTLVCNIPYHSIKHTDIKIQLNKFNSYLNKFYPPIFYDCAESLILYGKYVWFTIDKNNNINNLLPDYNNDVYYYFYDFTNKDNLFILRQIKLNKILNI